MLQAKPVKPAVLDSNTSKMVPYSKKIKPVNYSMDLLLKSDSIYTN